MVSIALPVIEADMIEAVGGAASDDDFSVADHTADRLSSTKDDRQRQRPMVVPDDIRPVYVKYRVAWEDRMRQLDESIYIAEELKRQKAETENN